MKKRLLLVMFAFICGCNIAMPVSNVRTLDDRPSISIKGASEEDVLFIDGIAIGKACIYNGLPNVLKVEPGTHRVKVTEKNSILYDKDVFVESELKIITVR